MGNAWLEVVEAGKSGRRVALSPGRTRIGGDGSDVPLLAEANGELHFWDEPPRVVSIGAESLVVDGAPRDDAPLRDGTEIRWGGLFLVFHATESPGSSSQVGIGVAPLEELPLPGTGPPGDPQGADAGKAQVVSKRLQAGLLVDLGLADRATTKRWQDAVIERTFDPDRCATELVQKSLARVDDDRMADRSAVLLRDFLMAPLAKGVRGTGRRARHAARGGAAFLIAQFTALLVYTVIVLASLVVLRLRGTSLDELLDRVLMR